MKLRFGLKTLIATMILASVLVWIYTQLGFRNAHFEIIAAGMMQDSNGRVTGQINYRMDLLGNESAEYGFYAMMIGPIEASQLLEIEKGNEFNVSFRGRQMWPMKREDPHRAFITRRLGLDDELIIGYATMSDHKRIAIGHRSIPAE